jgi:hypothetical protein
MSLLACLEPTHKKQFTISKTILLPSASSCGRFRDCVCQETARNKSLQRGVSNGAATVGLLIKLLPECTDQPLHLHTGLGSEHVEHAIKSTVSRRNKVVLV